MNRIDPRKDRNYCILDGSPCDFCNKCEHMPIVVNQENNQSNNWLIKFLLAIIIALTILLLLTPIVSVAYNLTYDLLEEPTHNYDTYTTNYQDNDEPDVYYHNGQKIYNYNGFHTTCPNGNC